LATVTLLALSGSTSTSSSVPAIRTTLPLHIERHFPALVDVPLESSTLPAAAAREAPEAASVPSQEYLLSLPFGREIGRAADAHRVDRLLLASVVEAESSFRADAVSPKGALGLMQLLPLHFAEGARPFDPVVNLATGAQYLASLERRFGGDLELALAAYHAGPGTVERYGGLPPYRETRVYVGRVLERWREHRASAGAAQRGS
jgi:soluble lytic murein transglycosylase-like protein